MVLLMWGWVHQRIRFRFRPTVWRRRYLVLTTMSIHVHRSERGVISSLFPEYQPIVHVWSNFRSAKSYTTRFSSAHTFLIEPRDPKLFALKFKCVTSEEKDKWLSAINAQLRLTAKIWANNLSTISVNSRSKVDRPTISVSVLDKWLEQLKIMDDGKEKKIVKTITHNYPSFYRNK